MSGVGVEGGMHENYRGSESFCAMLMEEVGKMGLWKFLSISVKLVEI